jgi:hypothetical protein
VDLEDQSVEHNSEYNSVKEPAANLNESCDENLENEAEEFRFLKNVYL